jgi:predicted ATPase
MKTIALIGSHGTGKSTVFEELKKRKPDYKYFSSAVRHMMPALGYKNAWELINRIGTGQFELMNMSTWAVIDPKQNTQLKPEDTIITDRSAVDYSAYFLTLRERPTDYELGDLIKGIAKHYSSLVDHFIYFPTGVFPFKADHMQLENSDFQEKADTAIPRALHWLGIPEKRVYRLRSAAVEDRVEEALEFILRCNNK